MSPESSAPRSTPGWLRVLVLAGVGLVLLSPLIYVGCLNRGRNRPDLARDTADRFLFALMNNDPTPLETLLPLRVFEAATNPGRSLSGMSEGQLKTIRQSALRSFGQLVLGLGSPEIQGGLAQVSFTAEIGIPEIHGGAARVPFTLKQQGNIVIHLTHPSGLDSKETKRILQSVRAWAKKQEETGGVLLLVWDGDGWLVTGMIRPGEAGQGKEVDFFQLASRRPAESEVKAFMALTAIDAKAFDKAWREDLIARNEPAGKLLRRLANEVGIGFPSDSIRQLPRKPTKNPPSQPEWERKPITLTIRGRSRLEIIDLVARQAGIELTQSDRSAREVVIGPLRSIRWTLKPSGPDWRPVVGVAGPFRIEAEPISEDPRHATGSLVLDAKAAGLPGGVANMLTGWHLLLPDPEVRGDDGRDLFHADRRERMPLPEFLVPTALGWASRTCGLRWQIPLRNLTLDVSRIRSVRGVLVVPLPVRMETKRILFVGANGTERIGPVELAWQAPVNLTETSGAPSAVPARGQEMSLTSSARTPARAYWMAIDAAGEGWRAGKLTSGAQKLSFPEGMSGLEIKVFTVGEIRYPFTLENIPTTARPIARLASVEFPGHPAPLSLQTGFTPERKATLRITNHTEKPVEEMHLAIRCLDGKGDQVGQLTVIHPPRVRSALPPPAVVEARATAPVQLSADFPTGTARIEAGLSRVLFLDGTTWPGR